MSETHSPRVVVTGLGVVSSIGTGVQAFREALESGRHGASPVRCFSTDKFPSSIGCEVTDFDPAVWIRNQPVEGLGRSAQMAVAAARMALADAGIAETELTQTICDVSLGTTDGEAQVFDRFTEALLNGGEDDDDMLPRLHTAEEIADAVQEEFQLQGDSIVLATACSAGNYALGYAFDRIREGLAEVALCGASDSQCLKNFGGFFRIGALAPEKCRPFDLERKGILPGEGAAVLVLETLDRAIQRGAVPYAEVLGYGASCDGHHIMQPQQEGIEACARDAMERCGISPEDVDYICAHGTATDTNDVVECAAMHSVFGDQLPAMSSIKSMLGHTMGAASAMSAVACSLAVKYGFMPPTVHFEQPDPSCDIDCVPNESRQAELNIVQNNAFAFGGNNAIVILRRYSGGV